MADLYKVQRIIGKRIRDSKFIQYKVKWQGYPTSQSTWEPVKNLKTVQNLIDQFESRNKDKLPPASSLKSEHKNAKFGATLQKKLDAEKSISKFNSLKTDQPKALKKPSVQKDEKPKKRTSARLQASAHQKDQKKPSQEAVDLDIDDIDIEEEEIHNLMETSNGSEKSDILDANLENIAFKIMCAVEEKKKQPKIVDIYKKSPEEVLYLIEDFQGHKEYKDKEFIIKTLSRELIEFYESKVPLSQTIN